ncbi:hypothetical protein [Desulforamulus ruminis]|uniref:VCBS repeat-containing protein n=1 Tax=Desulforamulus ruminis (strain ATCC 23193 / DSM 2154 / NCIMB 8452 / DL) TaxID=696281 RepID=F6DLE3_DESRL|nr:hypothetical protein [Desulforamulus ruminis]AEG60491.1 hypothetical protein Desru_2242 [Desulforamulus ruminis DSM 2154]
MEFKKKLAALLLAGILLTGCRPLTPPELVKPPEMNRNQQELLQAARQFLPEGASLTLPKGPAAKTGSFLEVDVDGNGTQETAVFYKKEGEVGLLILAMKEGKWELRDRLNGEGSDLGYVVWQDFNDDKIPELLIGRLSNWEQNNDLTVYRMAGQTYQEVNRIPYASFSVGDVKGDGQVQLAVLAKSEAEFPTSQLTLYSLREQKLVETLQREYDGYPEQVLIGRADKNQPGIFCDLGVGAHSAYTLLLIYQDGQWTERFNELADGNGLTFKAYPLPSKDVDQDGIVEIGMQKEPLGAEDLPMVAKPWINVWYRWDGQKGLLAVREDYSDYGEEYSFVIPRKWIGKYTIERRSDDEGVKAVDFYYIGRDKKSRVPLLSISYQPKDRNQASGELPSKRLYVKLGENNRNVLFAVFPSDSPNLAGDELQEYKGMLLTEEEVKDCFKTIDMANLLEMQS